MSTLQDLVGAVNEFAGSMQRFQKYMFDGMPQLEKGYVRVTVKARWDENLLYINKVRVFELRDSRQWNE